MSASRHYDPLSGGSPFFWTQDIVDAILGVQYGMDLIAAILLTFTLASFWCLSKECCWFRLKGCRFAIALCQFGCYMRRLWDL
ncbi:hypothetical protein BDN70DRAFT_878737 [Pholiota conissans]|uniref:Uncharacterized protein n=1 Tax=Pholiota conissans TaxID=109636 RepID=A0A9P5Z3Y5_9AGAR|nr:hypothetical protein BDN70DRAFT_878737 [Pholiota conissans]